MCCSHCSVLSTLSPSQILQPYTTNKSMETTTISNTETLNALTPLPITENPKKTLTLEDSATTKPNLQHKETLVASADDAPLSDVEKKIRRAERFGISVQLSEQEKRNSRAQRFGTASTLDSSDASKSEELKRKARAERFGMPTPITTADEDAKKKARLARFAPISKTDPLEDEKRKAKAFRFSNPSPAIASKAGSGA